MLIKLSGVLLCDNIDLDSDLCYQWHNYKKLGGFMSWKVDTSFLKSWSCTFVLLYLFIYLHINYRFIDKLAIHFAC